MSKDLQGLLEARDCFVRRGPVSGCHPSLPKVAESLAPQLAPHRMMGESIRVVADPVSMLRLDRTNDASVQRTALIGEQTGVCDFLRQRMLEAIERLDARTSLVKILETVQFAK